MGRFCVNCGAEESSEIPIIDGLCAKCYLTLKKVLDIPKEVEIITCSRCGALSIAGRWFYPSSSESALNLLERYIASLVKPATDVVLEGVSLRLVPPRYREAKVFFTIKIKGMHRHSGEAPVNILWKRTLCPTCFKRAGKSFEAIIQLRFLYPEPSAKKFIEEVLETLHDYITEVEELDEGYDIKVVSQSIARRIVDMAKNKWGSVKVIESYGDVKRARDGSRRGRLYLSVRVINLREGDYIVIDGKAYTVVSVVEGRGVRLRDSDGVERFMRIEDVISRYEKHRRGR